MFKRILVAIDGSPTADRGLRLALELAREHDATLYVLHVVNEMVAAQGFEGGAFVSPQFVDELLAALREAGQKILSRAEKLAEKQGKPVKPLLVETLGQGVAHEVLTQARKLRAELIVLGTHGRRGLSRLVMGSDAEAILREARVPVLLVRSPAATRTSRGMGSPGEVSRRAAPPRAKKSAAAPRRPVRRPGSA